MISCFNISKSYKGKIIFSDLNIQIKQGTTIICGSNGSGKSTLLRLISNIEKPDEGHITYKGEKNASELFALSTPSIEIPDVFTPLESFQLLKKYNPVDESYYAHLVELLNLTRFVNTRLSEISTGTLKKVSLVNALCKKSEVLLLDEPFNGLDTESINHLSDELASDRRSKIIVDHTNTNTPDFMVNL